MKAIWWGVIALSTLALAATWSFWGGWCVDGENFSQCGVEPVVTWPVAGVVTVLAVGAILVAIVKLRKSNDRPPTWTAH